MQAKFYPKGPQSVPADLTLPNKKFKKHVWIASIALVLFMLLYFGLSSWFLFKAYKLFANTFTGGRNGFLSFLYAVLLGFLGVFMFKALFFITKRDKSNDIEIKEEDEPELFNFIYQIADEAKAPRPHKVFISTAVNASVFYDISVINLIFPSKKNLEIGLGLVNTLNLAEFKSILAHEFGHFAQRSMIIGRWVYIAHKVAYQIVAKRDGFDNFLTGLSRTDFRVAWIGWLLSVIIWSIRFISEAFFKLVLITQRALSREMEFHADLVAVSLTGSDSLVHSLYKLNAADEAYEEAISFVNKQLKKKKAVSDIFSIQSNAIKHMAVVLNNPLYGLSPKVTGDGAKFKVFKEKIAQAPKMWSTHPANIDREKNAKNIYIRSEVDERSSWILFKDPDALKNKLTLSLYTHLKIETTPLLKEESLELHTKDFERSFLLPKYRGVYLGRDILITFKKVEDMYDVTLVETDLTSDFLKLYPESLQNQLSHLKNLKEELELLEGINNKVLDANEGKINYRDKEINRKQLPEAIEEVKKEVKTATSKINEYDHFCRNLHYKAAKKIGNDWREYLVSLTALIHYCEHARKNIEEQSRVFYETLNVVTKILNITDSELLPLFRAADALHKALENVFTNGKKIKLSQNVIDKLEIEGTYQLLEPFELGNATRENINNWINVLPGWINLPLEALATLKEAALDELLKTEEYIEKTYLQSEPASIKAPTPIILPENYPVFDEDKKQEVAQKRDIVSRIYNADGLFPTIVRITAAAAVIIIAIFFSGNISQNNIVIYNGLPIDVIVNLNEQSVTVPHDQSTQVFMDETSKLDVKTTSTNGVLIESFVPDLAISSQTYLYNIASAALLYKWKAYYGISRAGGNNDYILLGVKQWSEIDADHYFEEPPESISLKSGQSEIREIVSVYTSHPEQLASAIKNETERTDFITAHAKWEKSNSAYLLSWLSLASDLKNFPEILQSRLKKDPLEIASLRMQQDYYKGEERTKYCKQHQQMYLKDPENPDFYYLNIRSMEDGPQQDEAFIAGYKKWPDNQWLAYSSAHCFIQHEDWENAITCFNVVNAKAPELREAIVEEMKRVCHLLKKDTLMTDTYQLQLPYLNFVTAVENSEEDNKESLLFAYKLIANGKIQQALDYAAGDSSLYNTITRLAAVSNGATEEMMSKALALPPAKDIDKATLIPAIGLLAKKNLPFDVYTDYIKAITANKENNFFDFIKYIKANKINEADKLLVGMRAEMKGKTSLLGVILLGNKAPQKWRDFASGLLFINEMPYFGDVIN